MEALSTYLPLKVMEPLIASAKEQRHHNAEDLPLNMTVPLIVPLYTFLPLNVTVPLIMPLYASLSLLAKMDGHDNVDVPPELELLNLKNVSGLYKTLNSVMARNYDGATRGTLGSTSSG